MGQRQITISDPLSVLPDLRLFKWQDSTPVTRGTVYKRKFERVNILGSAIVSGPAHASRCAWACNFALPAGDAVLLERYAEIQRLRTHLWFTDEFEFMASELITGARTLVPNSTQSIPLSYTTQNPQSVGFARFPVLLIMPDNPMPDWLFDTNINQQWKLATFSVEELPEVIL
jgi:hypothetical protein